MKSFFKIILLLSIVNQTYGNCKSSGLHFWPNGNTISQNPIILIDGVWTSQEIIKGLGEKYPIYLKSKTHKVALTVKELLVGQYNLTQAVLVPAENLKAGQEYELIIEKLTSEQGGASLLTRWNDKSNKSEKIKWIASPSIDTDAPTWENKPKEQNKTNVRLGCGPEMFVTYTHSVKEISDYLVKTTVRNKETNTETTYYLKPEGNEINVGRHMCSGAFTFDDGNEFEVTFTLVDASGNTTLWKDDKLSFTKPIATNGAGED